MWPIAAKYNQELFLLNSPLRASLMLWACLRPAALEGSMQRLWPHQGMEESPGAKPRCVPARHWVLQGRTHFRSGLGFWGVGPDPGPQFIHFLI